MTVTFRTKAHASITMLGEDGSRMLEMMGFGTPVPGAIDAADVGRALENLRAALARLPTEPAEAEALIELLQSAVDAGEYVRWD